MKKYFLLPIAALFTVCSLHAQSAGFTEQDSLRGSITEERAWWDLLFYDLKLSVDPEEKFIQGENTIRYKVIDKHQRMQIDLQDPLKIIKITQDGKQLSYTSKGNAHFVNLVKPQIPSEINEIVVTYSGMPRVAKNAPWDGGFSWSTDANGLPFVATSCQGLGASVWWPNKDHMYDEPDSMAMSFTVPKDLVAVGNGRLKKIHDNKDTRTFDWYVSSPINNYGVNINIGDYVNFSETYIGEKGNLDISYYVLRDHLEKAKIQFKQVPMMFQAFEHWFGPYPFYEDSFKLVEVPYLGMEHQSSVTYGNKYQNGYLGYDLSGSGWGKTFDFIIIHEAGHEWFANNITNKDVADMWIHEGFTAYSENLYLDYHFGKVASQAYVIGTRQNIKNDRPIIGPYNVNKSGSGDMYYKGANILHTLRQLLEDDEKWRRILRKMNEEFYHQTVTSAQIEAFLSQNTGIDLTEFFEQYLRTTMIPVLEYEVSDNSIRYRYTEVVPKFDMPVRVLIGKKEHWLFPSSEWKTEKLDKANTLMIDPNFYIKSSQLIE